MYLIDISDNYPESYWLEYDSQKFPDPLLLKIGKLVDPDKFSHAYLTANSRASIKKLMTYDYLFSSGPEIISEKLAKLLISSEVDAVQLIPTRIKHSESFYENYYIINYLSVKKSFDLDECEFSPIIKSMPNGPKKFTKISLLDSPRGNFIFRAEESLQEVAVTDDLAKIIKDEEIKGIKLIKEKTRF